MEETNKKLQNVIIDQGTQMISLIDISNTFSEENDKLKEKLNKSEIRNKEITDLYNLQTLLFVLLIMILMWIVKTHRLQNYFDL